ncbi:MAG: tetratricopeptide repeat protein [Alphaproteobacteria bacterium]|nr:tetratricopeptide repeat protein [Alphaproteobacteria bacterium]
MATGARERFERLMALAQTGDLEGAQKAIAAALRVSPKDPNILHLAAQLEEMRGQNARAIMFYRRARRAHPHWFEAGMNLARLLIKGEDTSEAAAVLKEIAQTHPARPEPLRALAGFLQQKNELPQAARYWELYLKLQKDDAAAWGQYLFCCRQMCVWDHIETPSALSLPPQTAVIFSDDPVWQKDMAEKEIARRFADIKPLAPAKSFHHERKRIGYLSSDFHAHATSWLVAELFELHDRSHFEVYVYSYGIEDHSPIRARLQKAADHFITLGALTAAQSAQKIAEDEIDILIDLKGHTQGAHLDILAHRPAQTQLHWLGFPGTTGSSFIDGFIGDSVTIPQGQEIYFTERVLRMPHSYQINDRQKHAAEPLTRSAYGLPEDALILANFNQSYKITPDIFDLWCAILKERPRTVLWLYEANPFMPLNLKKEAQKREVDPARLIFAKPLGQQEHLARYNHADLVLDTFHIGGHTTTSDALWMGVPVVCLKGKSFISRVAASLLEAANLKELVTTNMDDYKNLILALIDDRERLKTLTSTLQKTRTTLPLFNTPRFVHDFEALLLDRLKEN